MVDWAGLFGAIGLASVGTTLILFGLLSKRMARATGTSAYYIGFYPAAFLVFMGVLARLIILTNLIDLSENSRHNIKWILFYNGLPALGITLGVGLAWYYWSWLLAERS